MLIKFYKVKDSEIRRVYEVNDAGEKVKPVAVIGTVKELLEREWILPDGTDGNMDKWLVLALRSEQCVAECDTLEQAKNWARSVIRW